MKVTTSIVNDIRNFVFGLAGASVYGSCKRRKQKFVMSFTIEYDLNYYDMGPIYIM